ncbi:hypothetical protein ACFVZH_02665 [Streptomyces sp. NPDC059534]|uniref:hypothetical protein n=1 Tax=Streptomyces sp. NPDC059534 TaxID=3346859 RepID=UPI00369A002D
MKNHYRATRGDKNALIRDIAPGDSLFIINEHAGDSGPSRTYREYIVTDKKDRLTGHPIVQATSHGGRETVVSVLNRERDIYSARPTGIPNVAVKDSHSAYSDVAHRAAQRAAEAHAEDAAATLASQFRRLARR